MFTQLMNPAGRFGNDNRFGSVIRNIIFLAVDKTDIHHLDKTSLTIMEKIELYCGPGYPILTILKNYLT